MFCEKISDLCGLSGSEIVQRMGEDSKDSSDAERKSWGGSLPKLISAVHNAGLDNLFLATEYELPAGGRIDAVLMGDSEDGTHRVLVIELKQWSRGGVEYYGRHIFPVIRVNATQPYLSRHPVNQAKEYMEALNANHSNVVNHSLKVDACQYLHNFELSEKGFFVQGEYKNIDISHMFVKGEEAAFAEYLNRIFSSGRDSETAKNLFILRIM